VAWRSRLKDPKFCRGRFDDPTKMDLGNTLAQKLIPVADNIRNLFTRFGLRPYKIAIVRVRWSGGRRGRGVPTVVSSTALLPTPMVQDLSTLVEVASPVGLDETGAIVVSQISGSYTDDDLRFTSAEGQPPGPDEEVFYEIEYPQPGGNDSIRRRFYIRGAPYYDANQFQWTVRLERANEDRTRTGDPR
jgi:hypothetical protein